MMRYHYFPRAGRRRKNAILTMKFQFFPSGRQSERNSTSDARRALRAGEASCLPSRSKYLHCLTYGVCLVCRYSVAANRVRGAASATANHGTASAGALSLQILQPETMLVQIKRVAPRLGPAIAKLALPLNCCIKKFTALNCVTIE